MIQTAFEIQTIQRISRKHRFIAQLLNISQF